MTLLLTGAACGGSATSPAAGGLKVLVPVQGALLDPTQASIQSLGILLLGLEPLQRLRPDGSLRPNLATEVEQPDPRTFVYTIRSGVRFWDGTPLTADDVVHSFNLHAAKGSKSINASLWASVSNVAKTGEDEVTVELAEPDPQFPYVVAQTGIVSKAFYEKHKGNVGTPAVMNMGTGPYEFASFKPSSETVLRANPEYWGDKPAHDEVTARTVGDDSTRLLAVQSGEFDGIFNVPLNQLRSYAGLEGFEQAEAPDYAVYKFNFDTSKAPWDDIHLRRAVTLAINRADLIKGPLGGKATPAPTLVPADVMTTLAATDEVSRLYQRLESDLQFDMKVAKQEMARSSVPDGVSVTVPVTGSDPNLSAIAQTAAQSLAEIGVELKIQEVDDNTYYDAVYFKHTTDGFTLDNFGATSPDPANLPLYCLLSANGLPDGSGVNIAEYSDPQVDNALQRSQRLGTEDPKRGALLLDALESAAKDIPYVPIAHPNVYAVGNSKLDLSHFSTFWWLTDWTRLGSS
ncbi:hypothetical protein BAY60_29545 [Prauserella muralis]|uniref:Solute-binding protein family 5 domain-containing protein n=2 Tax=Prauserella muralis TaxID=588067 RepID=A0A2V4AGI9_9PSEU|nr:hypothetical protein BAY60_29545 [Prauserella muralis]TWE28856.1 peptide/nickel transport system substrate-binding protein [Prauserella muralis]